MEQKVLLKTGADHDVMEQIGVTVVYISGPKAEGYLYMRLVEQGGQLEASTDYIILR